MSIFDLLFGDSTPPAKNPQEKKKSRDCFGSMTEQEYYEHLYDEALGGDESAIQEMREEFGDDWK